MVGGDKLTDQGLLEGPDCFEARSLVPPPADLVSADVTNSFVAPLMCGGVESYALSPHTSGQPLCLLGRTTHVT